MSKHICKNCSKLFTRYDHDSYLNIYFCTFRCEKIFENNPINCDNCNNKFIPTRPNQKRCSAACRIIKSRNSQQEKREEINPFNIILKRDNFKCIYCGKSSIEDGIKLHIDHVFPISKGGENDFYNLVTSCISCNLSKNNEQLTKNDILRIWKRNLEIQPLNQERYDDLKVEFDLEYNRRNRNKI